MWWGVAAALLANTLYSLGFVLEKRALTALPEVTIRQPARLLRLVLGSPLWIAGSVALASGFGAQLVVYRTLPIAAAQGASRYRACSVSATGIGALPGGNSAASSTSPASNGSEGRIPRP